LIDAGYIRRMALYNRWQNQSLYGAAETLSDAQRRSDEGAFWGSVHKTLAHILWGDQVWMSRLDNQPPPKGRLSESMRQWEAWSDLRAARDAMDSVMIEWADRVDTEWLKGEYSWHSIVLDRTLSRPVWMLVTHMFNHQTHHRGQVHALLTRFGAKPDDTDLALMED
jgi:uncharacterized damage-inducible protein DinB